MPSSRVWEFFGKFFREFFGKFPGKLAACSGNSRKISRELLEKFEATVGGSGYSSTVTSGRGGGWKPERLATRSWKT